MLRSERVNYWTHRIGMLTAVPATILLLAVSLGFVSLSTGFIPFQWFHFHSPLKLDLALVSLIYGCSVIFLFAASSQYHKYKKEENERSTRRTLDHFAIFVMIAGTYTPLVYVWFPPGLKEFTLAFQWSITLLGLIFKLYFKKAPRWVDPILYLLMGWVAIIAIVPLYQRMPFIAFFDMLLGGVWYTLGALFYVLKRPNFKPGYFGFHELFHVFILAGAASHFSMILRTIIHGSI